MRTDVIDLSHDNGPVDFHALYASGTKGVILKASQGADFRDPTFDSLLTRAKSVGMLVGAYHFVDGEDPDDQWSNFKAVIEGNGDLLMCLDYEENPVGSQPTPGILSHLIASIVGVTGKHPVVYGSDVLKQIDATNYDQCPVWAARYDSLNPPTWPDELVLWQWSETGSVTTPGDVDCSQFMLGTIDIEDWWASRACGV